MRRGDGQRRARTRSEALGAQVDGGALGAEVPATRALMFEEVRRTAGAEATGEWRPRWGTAWLPRNPSLRRSSRARR